MSNKRDDFATKTKDTLAKRAGMKCSICDKTTCGPHSDTAQAINMGKAAHIAAASPGGPRYDESMTPLQRKSIDNGIWLCGPHADIIDKDEKKYPVAELIRLKNQAEERASKELENSSWGTLDDFPDLSLTHKYENRNYDFDKPGVGGITFILQSLSEYPITIRSMFVSARVSLDFVRKLRKGIDMKCDYKDEYPAPIANCMLELLEGDKVHDGYILNKNSTCRFFLPICNFSRKILLFNGEPEPDLKLVCELNNGKKCFLAYHEELYDLVSTSLEIYKNMLDVKPDGFTFEMELRYPHPPDMSEFGKARLNTSSIGL
jgi:hypothetical protein